MFFMNTPILIPGLFELPLANMLSAFRMSNLSGQLIVIILFIGSIFAWSAMVTKLAEMRSATRAAEKFVAAYRKSEHPLAIYLQQQRLPAGPLTVVYETVCRDLAHITHAQSPEDLQQPTTTIREHQACAIRNLAEQVMAEQALSLEKNMIFLATAVTAAPFLGLLGTVWGVMDAFGGLALSGMATMAAVAPGVSGALLTTVVGLVVALPSAIGYNFLTGKIRRINIIMEHFSQEFLADIESHFMR